MGVKQFHVEFIFGKERHQSIPVDIRLRDAFAVCSGITQTADKHRPRFDRKMEHLAHRWQLSLKRNLVDLQSFPVNDRQTLYSYSGAPIGLPSGPAGPRQCSIKAGILQENEALPR